MQKWTERRLRAPRETVRAGNGGSRRAVEAQQPPREFFFGSKVIKRPEKLAAHGVSCCHQAAACGGSWQPRMAGAVAIRQQRAVGAGSRAWRELLPSGSSVRWELAAAHGGSCCHQAPAAHAVGAVAIGQQRAVGAGAIGQQRVVGAVAIRQQRTGGTVAIGQQRMVGGVAIGHLPRMGGRVIRTNHAHQSGSWQQRVLLLPHMPHP